MKKLLLTCLSAVVLSANANAQLSYGPEGGLNLSNYVVNVPSFLAPTTVYVPGVHAGAFADYAISDQLSIQPAAFFALNGIKYSYSFPLIGYINFAAHINTIHIPINVIYRLGEPGQNRFFFGAGPFVGINLGGSVKVKASVGSLFGGSGTSFDSSSTIAVGSDTTDYIKRFDLGVGVNAGYQLTNGLFFRAFYQRGFINLSPQSDFGYTTKSVNYGICVGYFFGGKPVKKAKEIKKAPVKKR